VAYRNGTYVAFHAGDTTSPTDSDIRYFNLLKAWKVRSAGNFEFIDSHDKNQAVRDTSKHETLRRALVNRLLKSKNMILIITDTTKKDTDWVPYEIRYAVDQCEIPIIAAYPGMGAIKRPSALSSLWPQALATRISDGSAHVIHVPFEYAPLADAVGQFGPNKFPLGNGLGRYTDEAYTSWGLR
jgi:hypothetical protein